MQVGDLVQTVYRDEYAVIIKVWWATVAAQHAAQFVYPDGTVGVQPNSNIREVISASR